MAWRSRGWRAIVIVLGAAVASLSLTTSATPFGDVEADTWYSDATTWMEVAGISTGTSPGCFQPHRLVNRAEAVTFLHRLAGEPTPAAPHPFVDVHLGWAQTAVSWAAEVGVTTGVAPDRFAPTRLITRGEFAAFLHRMAGSPDAPPSPFIDVRAAYQQAPVAWMADQRVTTGTSAREFSPDRLLSRAEVATFLHRFAETPEPGLGGSEVCERRIVIHATGDVNFAPGYGPGPGLPFSAAWDGVGDLFRLDDLTIINLECAPSALGTPVTKTYNFRCPLASLAPTADAGVDVANLANNHGGDYGIPALLDGVQNVAAAGIAPVGAGADLAAALRPATFELGGHTVAVLGFNGIGSSWHADVGVAGMAPDDPAVVAAAIAAADQVADIVIVTIHWGVELASGPTSADAALGRAMIDAGADAVLGHHPHVVQPMTTHLGRPIFWSLGNFVWHNRISRSGVAEIVIDPDGTVTGRMLPATIVARGQPVLG